MYVALLYNAEGNCIAQIEDILSLQCELKLNGVSQAKLHLDISSPYISKELLKMWRHIRIVEWVAGEEYELLEWVIRGIESDFWSLTIIAESWRTILEKRLVVSAQEWDKVPLKTIVETVFWAAKQKADFPFQIVCTEEDDITLSVGARTTLSSFLSSLSHEGVDCRFKWKTLFIWKKLWRKRDEGNLYKEFRYDIEDPEGNTIDKAKLIINAKEITNNILTEQEEVKDEESIQEFWLLQESRSNEDISTYLKEHKNQISEFSISVSDTFFYDIELWDQVRIFINGWNELLAFNGTMKVIGKKLQSWDLPKIEYTLSTQRVPEGWFMDQLAKMSEKIKKL